MPDEGSITINDEEITRQGFSLIDIRKRIGLVFQYPEYRLFEEDVKTDVAFGPKNLGLDIFCCLCLLFSRIFVFFDLLCLFYIKAYIFTI